MSFVITVYVPTGIVMASDSRQSITIERKSPDASQLPPIETVGSDFVYKTFLFERQKVGIQVWGDTMLGKVTTESHMKNFSEESLADIDDVLTIPRKLLDFFRQDYPKADTAFHIAGYKMSDRRTAPHVYRCHVGRNDIQITNQHPKTKQTVYGASWGGQADVVNSLLQPSEGRVVAPIIWDAMTVQDAVDFAIYAVRTTIDTMRFQARPKSVGGPIDVLLLRPDEPPLWIQRKQYRGELSPAT